MKKILSLILIFLLFGTTIAYAYTEAPNYYSIDFDFIKEGSGYSYIDGKLQISSGGYVVFSDELLFSAESVTALSDSQSGSIRIECGDQSVEIAFSSGAEKTEMFSHGVHKNTKDITVYATDSVTLNELRFNRYPLDLPPVIERDKNGELLKDENGNYVITDRKEVALPDITDDEMKLLAAFAVKVDGNAYMSNGAVRYIDYNNPHIAAKLIKGRTYVPAQALATGLHLYWEIYPDKAYILLRDENKTEFLSSSDISYFKKETEEKTEVKSPVVYIEGIPYLPLRLVCELFGKTVLYKDGIAVVDTFKNANYILKTSSTWEFLRAKLDAFNPNYTGTTYYVAQNAYNADDRNDGSMEAPFKTISAASAVANAGDTVIIHEGVYRETVTPLNSGSKTAPITYKAFPGETVTVSALDEIKTSYALYDLNGRTDVVVADLDAPLAQGKNMIFYKNDAIVEGRHPNEDNANPEKAAALNLGQLWPTFGSIVASGEASNKLVSFKGDLDNYPDGYWVGATYVGERGSGWTLSTAKVSQSKAPVAATEATDTTEATEAVPAHLIVTDTSEKWWYGNAAYDETRNIGYLTGHINTIDKAGEWYVDDTNKKLYICLPDGETKDSLKLEYKVRQLVFDLRNKDNIIIDGIKTVGGGITMHNGNMNVINNCDLRYISHYTWSDDQRDGFIDDVNTRNKTAAPARGEVGVYMDGENCVIANTKINYSAAAGIYSSGSYALIENNYITDCGYMGSYVAGINMEAPGWKGSDKDYKHGGEHIYKNTVRRAGRAVMNIACVGSIGADYAVVLPFDICYNDLSDGLIYNRDGGIVYEHGVFVGTDIKRAKMHHNSVSNQWHGKYTPSSAIYHDNWLSYQETYDNLIFQNNGYGYSPMVYTQDPGHFPDSYATTFEWGNGRISGSKITNLSDIDYNLYPGGRPYQLGSSLEKGVFMHNFDNRLEESGWYSPDGESLADGYITFNNVDFGSYSNVLSMYFTGDKYNTGDVIDVIIGDSIETGKVIKTQIKALTTELDYNFSAEVPVGRIYGVNNVYVRAREYKSLNLKRIRPYYKENAVYTVEKLYGGEYDYANYGSYETNLAVNPYDSEHMALKNTYGGNYVKYENVDITSNFNKIKCSTASTSAHNGIKAEIYLNSMDSAPIATVNLESTGDWNKYVEKEVSLDKTIEKGIYDVYIKFCTPSKTCNWYYLSFIDDNAILTVSRLYGGEADEIIAGGATPVKTKKGSHYYVNNTVKDTILKYADVDFMTGFNTIRWCVACPKSYAGLQAEIYLDSLDSTPVATITVQATKSWDTFVIQELELPEEVDAKGVHDVYVKFITPTKTCNWCFIDLGRR